MADIPLSSAKTTCPHYTIMPTTNTNIYEISLRLVENTPLAVITSPDGKRQEKPPLLMRGVPAILRIRLFRAGGLVKAAELSELYTGFRLVIANDFDDTTAPLLVSDETGATIDAQNNCIVLPMSEMNTETLEAIIGIKDRLDLCAELQLFKPSVQDEPINAWQFPIGVQNRLDLTGTATPAPVSVNYYSKQETDAAIATAITAAQGISSQAVTTLSGASGTVEPGKVYSLDATEDFTFGAATLSGQYGEAVVFIRPNLCTISFPEGAKLDVDMTSGSTYRLLVSWTPVGLVVEQTGEWLD